MYYLAVDLIVKNATFSDATCADVSSDSVLVTNEVTMPLVIAATFGISVHEVSAPERALRVTAVWRCGAEEARFATAVWRCGSVAHLSST